MREDNVEVAFLIRLIRENCPIQAWMVPWALDDLLSRHPQLKPELTGPRQIVDASCPGDVGSITCKLNIPAAANGENRPCLLP